MTELNLVRERLAIGRERYGHGVRPHDDTRQWGTKRDSWLEMAQEELIDGMIYVCADYIRENNIKYEDDANDLIIDYIENTHKMICFFHANMVLMMKSMLSMCILRQKT